MVLWCDPSNLNLNKKNNARKKKRRFAKKFERKKKEEKKKKKKLMLGNVFFSLPRGRQSPAHLSFFI
jgi:hypothetical protein